MRRRGEDAKRFTSSPHFHSLSSRFFVLKPGGMLGFTDNVTVPDKQAARYYNAYEKLRALEMMRPLPPALEPLFAPRWVEGTLYFSLWEAVIVGRR